MFVGRKKELAALDEAYLGGKTPLVILYGRSGIGKTTLLREFAKDKAHIYYLGREYSKEEQKHYFEPVLEAVRTAAKQMDEDRICLFVDEFDQIHKGYKDFFQDFELFLSEPEVAKHVMVVFSSSSIQWIENEMVKAMNILATKITSFIKVKEFTFLEMVSRFPENTTEECIAIYGILGGVPGYLNNWNSEKSIKENIIDLFIKQDACMKAEATRFLKLDLRELSVYNTILSILAEDEYKLNYLYNRTGFSRAKISVSIKNQIELDAAYKIFSFETERRENIQKGLYGISDSFLHFWYKFFYPNLSELEWESPEDFYEQHISMELDQYMRLSYIRVCREFLDLMNQYKKLPIEYETIGSLYGKEGFIPLIAQSENGELLVGTCKWGMEPMTKEEFEELLIHIGQTGKEADYYFLFAKEGFTSELATMTAGMENITLVDLESL